MASPGRWDVRRRSSVASSSRSVSFTLRNDAICYTERHFHKDPVKLSFRGKEVEEEYWEYRAHNSVQLPRSRVMTVYTIWAISILVLGILGDLATRGYYRSVVAHTLVLAVTAFFVLRPFYPPLRKVHKFNHSQCMSAVASFYLCLALLVSIVNGVQQHHQPMTFFLVLLVFTSSWTGLLPWLQVLALTSVGICTTTFIGYANFYTGHVASDGSWPPWLGMALWLATLAVAYDVEVRERELFRVQKIVEQVSNYVAYMDIESCDSLLDGLNDGPYGPTIMVAQLKALVSNLGQYRPFLPDYVLDMDADDAFSVNECPESPNLPPFTPCLATPRLQGPSLQEMQCPSASTALTSRQGTLLFCRVNMDNWMPWEIYEYEKDFLETVFQAADRTQGKIQSCESDVIVLSWNLSRSCPQHQLEACLCALDIQKTWPDCRCVVVSSDFTVGIIGSKDLKFLMVHSPWYHLGVRLLHLTALLHCDIIITEGVYAAIQGLMGTVFLDNIQPDCFNYSVHIYGLVQDTPIIHPSTAIFRQGVSYLLRSEFSRAISEFLEITQGEESDGSHLDFETPSSLMDYHARRLCKVAKFLEDLQVTSENGCAAVSFLRVDTGWQYLRQTTEPEPNHFSVKRNLSFEGTSVFSIYSPRSPMSCLTEELTPHSGPGGLTCSRQLSSQRSSFQLYERTMSQPRLSPVAPNILRRQSDVQLLEMGVRDWMRGESPSCSMVDVTVEAAADHPEYSMSSSVSLPTRELTSMSEPRSWDITRLRQVQNYKDLQSPSSSSTGRCVTFQEDSAKPSFTSQLPRETSFLDNDAPMQFTTTKGEIWYCSKSLLGSGGFGEVYLGMNEHGMLAAIKHMRVTPTQADNLLNEIKLLATFHHSHIVSYLGSAHIGTRVMVVMEYIPCGSLAKVLGDFGVFPPSTARRYMRDVLFGLAYLHSHDVLHRDIKPQNVLLEQTGLCKLADFGTAAVLQQRNTRELMESGVLADDETVTAMCGTAQYMPPEALRGEVGKPGDIWAVGVMLLQLLTGHLLFEASNAYAALYFVMNLTEPPEIPDDLPEDAQEFLHACFALDPSERPTATALSKMPFLL